MTFTPRLKVFETLPTTMLEARAQARAGEPEGTTIMARAQTSGRGRLGRSWLSEPGTGIYATVILRPPADRRERFGELSLVSGIAICETVRSIGVANAKLKWPNDVLVDGRKIAGILLESDLAAEPPFVLVGIGVNFTKHAERKLPDDLVPTYTGIADHMSALPATEGRDPLASTLHTMLHWLAKRYDQWLAGGFEALLPAYADLDALKDTVVTISIRGGESFTGTAEGVNSQGELLVRGPNGVIAHRAGEVERVKE
ncbi:MAG: biotin--[acetyl-CoA-carboxylase] ligase [Clostridia bacterium]|nr:biotin--[acetyl-CoA-carboxylase] ligase [Deltaproteobacteria bacterium]